MNNIENVLYTAKTHTVGGREGSAKSSDEKLDILLSAPGSSGKGTNPEQLFAAGWSACYIGALGLAAKKLGIVLPKETYVDAEVDLGTMGGCLFFTGKVVCWSSWYQQRDSRTAGSTCPSNLSLFKGCSREY